MKAINILKSLYFLSFLAFLPACRNTVPENPKEESVRLRVTVLEEEIYREPILTSGKLVSGTELKLAFKTGGIIREIQATEGQKVRKGVILASLDLSEIEAEARKAGLAFDKALRDYNRVKNLYEDTVVTLSTYQDALTALDLARSNREIARFNLEHSEIRAPSDGKILRKLAEPGEMVAPGTPVFLFGSTASQWVVRANLTDRDIVRVACNDSASLTFDAFPGERFSARISETGNAADPYTGTFSVEMIPDRAPESLVSGLVARAEIFAGKGRPAIIIPASALIEGTGMEGLVYLIQENKAVKRRITLEAFTGRGLVVRSGLSPGEMLVTEGGQFILENSRIEIIPE